jgi:SAM-dependent methyltransferase
MAKEYWSVVDRIYKPKANFLKDFLLHEGHEISNTSILDVGCGSGHFINALLGSGFEDVIGVDSFNPAVEAGLSLGKLMDYQINCVEPGDTLSLLSNTTSSVVCMMCVLVHLDSPMRALEVMSKNPNIKYTYQKIPLWSFAAMLEASFPQYRARVLGADHTNVFTKDSLNWIEQALGMSRVASWTFGSDYLDLLRKMQVGLIRNGASAVLTKKIEVDLMRIANDMQKNLDENMLASEIHLIWKFSNREK